MAGSAPLIATVLIDATGWSVAPGLYLALTALVGLALVPRIGDRSSSERRIIDRQKE